MLIAKILVSLNLMGMLLSCLGRPEFKDMTWWWVTITLFTTILILFAQVLDELHL